MALDFNVLTQVPTFGERFMAGRQAAQEEAQRNMLLQQRQMEFQQSQEDRRLAAEERQRKAAQLEADRTRRQTFLAGLQQQMAQNGYRLDRKTLADVLTEGMQTGESNLVQLATKGLQALDDEDAWRSAFGGGAPAGAAPAAIPTPAAPQLGAPLTDAEDISRANALGRTDPRFAIATPVGEYPAEPPAPVANAMVAPPADAERQRLNALLNNPSKAIRDEARERLKMMDAAAKPAQEPSDVQTMRALGLPLTPQGYSQFNELKRDPDAASADIRGYRLAQQQGFKGSFMEYKQSLRPEPSRVEVKLPEQEKAFETELGKGQAKKLIDDKAVAEDARSIIDTVQQGRQLLQSGMITGFGAEALTQIGAALNQAGISFASDSVANTQAFAANMAQNVGRIIKQFGAGTGLSNADREYAEKMAGGKITLDRKAIERILDINERAARNVITAHNKRAAGVKTNVPLTVELPPAMPTAPAAAPAGRPSLQQIFQQPAGR